MQQFLEKIYEAYSEINLWRFVLLGVPEDFVFERIHDGNSEGIVGRIVGEISESIPERHPGRIP